MTKLAKDIHELEERLHKMYELADKLDHDAAFAACAGRIAEISKHHANVYANKLRNYVVESKDIVDKGVETLDRGVGIVNKGVDIVNKGVGIVKR